MKIYLFAIMLMFSISCYCQDECDCKVKFTPLISYASSENLSDKSLSNEVKLGAWGKGSNPFSILIGAKQFRQVEYSGTNESNQKATYYTNFKVFGEIGLKLYKTDDFVSRTYIQYSAMGIYSGLEANYIFENAVIIGVHYLTNFHSGQVGLNIAFSLK